MSRRFSWAQTVATAAILLVGLGARAQAQSPPAASSSPAGTFDLDKDRQAVVLLDGAWRFHLGNDPRYADPGFDDSGWLLVRPDTPTSQPAYSGEAWYRAKIRVPAGQGSISVYVTRIYTSYQLFADGQSIASRGGMPPRPHAYNMPPEVIAIPTRSNAQPRTLTLAIHVWHWPTYASYRSGGPVPGLRVGDTKVLEDLRNRTQDGRGWQQLSSIVLLVLMTLAALTALVLFGFRRREREYLWFGLMLLNWAIMGGYFVYCAFHLYGVREHDLLTGVFAVLGSAAEIAFYFRLLGGRRDGLFWTMVAGLSAALVLCLPEYFGWFSTATETALGTALYFPQSLWVAVLVIRRAIEGYPDARFLVTPVLFTTLVGFADDAIWGLYTLGWYQGPSAWLTDTIHGPFHASLGDLGSFFFLISMLAILVYRFTRTSRHEEAYEREQEAARSVQQVLVPQESPTIPGFAITSVYHPAGEVSGDFFQIVPLGTGGVLIVIGDVSGKGVPAALMVSLLVGALRTFAEITTSPAEILAGLNRRLYGRGGDGFTTCLVLRADWDGGLTLANAGHLCPYVAGKEVTVESGLPLGVLAHAAYGESRCRLAPGQSITLLTDGVVEARNASGELFGFDRATAVSDRSAAAIALSAREFGQEDDITVVKLNWLGSTEGATLAASQLG